MNHKLTKINTLLYERPEKKSSKDENIERHYARPVWSASSLVDLSQQRGFRTATATTDQILTFQRRVVMTSFDNEVDRRPGG